MKIVFIGDSVTKGTDYGAVTSVDTFAHKIGTSLGYAQSEIINAGVGSDTSAGVLQRLGTDVISKAPAVCVLMIGINDCQGATLVATYRANVEQIFAQLATAGIRTVGITSNLQRGSTAEILAFQPYLQAFEDAAGAAGVTVIDLYREVANAYLYLSRDQFYALYVDAIHLTVQGHSFVAELAARQKNAAHFL